MFRNFFDGPHLVLVALVIVVLFGWKKMPDAARSLGRSMRIFKSEIDEMKKNDKSTPSAASSDTVKGESVHQTPDTSTDPIQDPTKKPAADTAEREKHNQPPA